MSHFNNEETEINEDSETKTNDKSINNESQQRPINDVVVETIGSEKNVFNDNEESEVKTINNEDSEKNDKHINNEESEFEVVVEHMSQQRTINDVMVEDNEESEVKTTINNDDSEKNDKHINNEESEFVGNDEKSESAGTHPTGAGQ